MIYEVKEKKFHEVSDIKKILNYKAELKHLETTFELEKYLLDVNFFYIDFNGLERNTMCNLPIDFNTTMTEQLLAKLESLEVNAEENKGINLTFNIIVEVNEIDEEPADIIIDKKEIKEIYQQELEEKINERDEVIIENNVNLVVDDSVSIDYDFLSLKTEFVKYKVINLDEVFLDKISLKYNIPIDKLYNLKNSNNKLIVYDKE